jgi:hypothetical protein
LFPRVLWISSGTTPKQTTNNGQTQSQTPFLSNWPHSVERLNRLGWLKIPTSFLNEVAGLMGQGSAAASQTTIAAIIRRQMSKRL